MFNLKELESPVVRSEQQEDGSFIDVTYTHTITDTERRFRDEPCNADYDILDHNHEYLLSELWWLRKHSLPAKVSVAGNTFAVSAKEALREKCESPLYEHGATFKFKCLTGVITMTAREAQDVRDEIELQTQSVFNKYFYVEGLINNLTMDDIPGFDLEKEWGNN